MTASTILERRTRTEREIILVDRLQRRSKRIWRERGYIQRHMRGSQPWTVTQQSFFELRSAWTLTHLRAEVRKIQAELAILRVSRPEPVDPKRGRRRRLLGEFLATVMPFVLSKLVGDVSPEREQ